jgi:hypothetical protein
MKRQIRLSRATADVLCSSVLVTTQLVHARFEAEEWLVSERLIHRRRQTPVDGYTNEPSRSRSSSCSFANRSRFQ